MKAPTAVTLAQAAVIGLSLAIIGWPELRSSTAKLLVMAGILGLFLARLPQDIRDYRTGLLTSWKTLLANAPHRPAAMELLTLLVAVWAMVLS